MYRLYNLYEEAESVMVAANELEYLAESSYDDYMIEAEGEGFFQKIIRMIGECIQKLKNFFFGSKMKANLENGPKESNAEGKKVESEVNETHKGIKKLLEDTKRAKSQAEIDQCKSRFEKIKKTGLKVGAGVGIGAGAIIGTSFVSGLFRTLTATQEKCDKYAKETQATLQSAKVGTASKIELGVWKAKTSLFGQIASVCSQFGSKVGVMLSSGKNKDGKKATAERMGDVMKARSDTLTRDRYNEIKDQKFRKNIDQELKSTVGNKDVVTVEATDMIAKRYQSVNKQINYFKTAYKSNLDKAKHNILKAINSIDTDAVSPSVKKDLSTRLKHACSAIESEMKNLNKEFSKNRCKAYVIEFIKLSNSYTDPSDVANSVIDVFVGNISDSYFRIEELISGLYDNFIPDETQLKEKIKMFETCAKKVKDVANNVNSKIKSGVQKVKNKLPKGKKKQVTESVYDNQFDLYNDYNKKISWV